MVQTLSAEDARHLSRVRKMLEEAAAYATHASSLQRTTAVVLLDGAVERVTYLVAAAVGVPLGGARTPDLRGLVDDVKKRLPDAKLESIAKIRELHSVRNAAQHEGVSPDRDEVQNWTRAVQSYVRSLVDAQYGVAIEHVALTDAIQDDGFRSLLEDAERDLEAGRFDQCVQACNKAVEGASRSWKTLHGITHASSPMPSRSADVVRQRVDAMQAHLDLLTFSPDPAEAQWFTSVAQVPGHLLDADEAERALAFATDWVVGFEDSASTWRPDRLKQHNLAQRLVRKDGGTAYVREVIEVTAGAGGTLHAFVRIGNVPDTAHFKQWSLDVAAAGHDLWDRLAGVFPDGRMLAMMDLDESLEDLSTRLQEALDLAEARMEERFLTSAAEARAKSERAAEYNGQVARLVELPPLIRAAVLDVDYEPEAVRLELAPPAREALFHGQTVAEVTADVLEDDPDVGQCIVDEALLYIVPPVEPTTLGAIIARNHKALESTRLQAEAERDTVRIALARAAREMVSFNANRST
ncbi:hypothetical protein ACFT2C_06370 [Promicromonospora sp. NPDC057138]|uniref:hypothetical protein n=1 Tax=Promicromonospora sp. NPDC057138 TaxID=3346031 RepID=UPI00362ACBAE